MAEFSFEQDVAPFASRYFQRMQGNPLMSTASKAKLSDDLLSKLEAVKKLSDEDAEKSLSMEIRRTQLERERLALDDARLTAQQKRDAIAAEPVVNAEFETLLEGIDDPEEQTRRLNMFAMRNANTMAHSPALKAKYRFASEAILRPQLLASKERERERQLYRDLLSEKHRRESLALRRESNDIRAGAAAQRVARSERNRLDRELDVELESDPVIGGDDSGAPEPRYKNPADRVRHLNLMSELGYDTADLEEASDFTIFNAVSKAARTAKSTLTSPDPTAGLYD